MKIWSVKGDLNGRLCFDIEEELNNRVILYSFQSKDHINDWEKLKVTFLSNDKRTDILPIKNITLFWSYSNLFVCDEYAKQKISERFERLQFLEVTPVEKDIAQTSNYYLVNVLDIISGLDEEKCKFDKVSGKVLMDINKYEFSKDIEFPPIFYLRIEGTPYRVIYATDEFKDYVEKCGITGFTFTEVFDFEKKGES